ncbi:hypothetical protein GC175_28145 [bacterium]|nr:hypothetical protein [bacterium]
MSGNQQFQRLNFFAGLFTTAQDWIDEQAYHVGKAKLTNQILHRPGVAEGLTVRLHPDSEKKRMIVVEPGVALDALGNVIYVAARQEARVETGGDATQPIKVRLKLHVTHEQYFTNVQDPEYSGFTRQVENVCLIADRTPVADDEVELARIWVDAAAAEIKPSDIDNTCRRPVGAIDAVRDRQTAALAERLTHLHQDHLARQRRHNRGLHTVGVLHKIPSDDGQTSEFSVRATGGLSVTVWPGAAIDAAGNEIFLDAPLTLAVPIVEEAKCVYVAVAYQERMVAYLSNLEQHFTEQGCTAQFQVTDLAPDNKIWLALARINLSANATEIREPVDPRHPQPNEIDRCVRQFSGAVAVQPAYLDLAVQHRLVQVMLATRHHFAALSARFPTPSLEDVRYGAVHLQMTATSIDLAALFNGLNGLALVTLSTERELVDHYPALASEETLIDYKDAIAALRQTLQQDQDLDAVFAAQQSVAEAALLLSEVVFPLPVADAGDDQTVLTPDAQARVILDGSASEAGPRRKIVNYRWDIV